MSIRYDQKQKCWLIDFYWPDGMRSRKVMPDQETAKKIIKKIEVGCADEERIWQKLRRDLRLEGGRLQGFSGFVDELYWKQYVLVYNRSLRSKKSKLNILKAYFKSIPFDAITPMAVCSFMASRKRKGVSNKTINRDLASLRHMFKWAVDQGLLESSPIVRIKQLKETEWVGQRPEESQIDEIFSKLDARVKPVFIFLRETGCRRGETISLKHNQIDLPHRHVVFHTDTKNGRLRQVPLTDAAMEAVTAMPKYRDTVFYHPDTLRKWTGDGVAIPWEKAREAAGYPWLRIHDLRHAYGIKLAEEGCPMHYISEVMGHHSIDFTRKHYARFSPESASRAVLRILECRKDKKTGTDDGRN